MSNTNATEDRAADRRRRLAAKAREKIRQEEAEALALLESRPDRHPTLDYFLDLVRYRSPAAVAERTGRPVAALLCVQTPLELVHAFGFQPYKICGGSHAAGRLVGSSLPAQVCPMLRAVLGFMQTQADREQAVAGWIVPTTCDWTVKFPEIAALCDVDLVRPLHRSELPRLRDGEAARRHRLEAVYDLKAFLHKLSGKALRLADLDASLAAYNAAARAFSRLSALRLQGRVPAVWAMLIADTFCLDRVETWAARLEEAADVFASQEPDAPNGEGRIFLAGSPIFFPNYKLPHLLEEAGLHAVADDLCSGCRIFPSNMPYSDTSEHGLLSALAERYHQGCLCPTFADNERRAHNITNPATLPLYSGVVFHVLKGCHPYDLESVALENTLKASGLKFLRIETDYTSEDDRNILTRLEAFRHNLQTGALRRNEP